MALKVQLGAVIINIINVPLHLIRVSKKYRIFIIRYFFAIYYLVFYLLTNNTGFSFIIFLFVFKIIYDILRKKESMS